MNERPEAKPDGKHCDALFAAFLKGLAEHNANPEAGWKEKFEESRRLADVGRKPEKK